MVVVTVSETYDLSTVKDKMTLIGVHTPTKELIQKTYPGLCMNSKYCRIVKTDVVLSAVSGTVAITPDMVGDNSQDGIAPEDVLNPILYKAVSNDSWSTLEARLQGLLQQAQGSTLFGAPVLNGPSVFAENDKVTGLTDEFGVYYSLLSNRDGFKMAPIQHGLEMRGLVPMVFEKYFANGENYTIVSDSAPNIVEKSDGTIVKDSTNGYAMRGRPHPMPRFNTTFLTSAGGATNLDGTSGELRNGMGPDGSPYNTQIQMPFIVPVMLCAILMPPCRKTKLFFRMRVRTYLEFTEVRPIQEITSFAQMSAAYAPIVYHSDYVQQSSKMDNTTDLVDTKNADITKIMEGR